MRTCLRCGSVPVDTTDGEVTCPNSSCPESRISFTVDEWEDVRTLPAIDFLQIFRDSLEADTETLEFMTRFMSGQLLEQINGIHFVVYMISQVSTISMQVARMNSIVQLLEGKYKK